MRRTAGQSAAVIGAMTMDDARSRGTTPAILSARIVAAPPRRVGSGRVDGGRRIERDRREEGLEQRPVDVAVEGERVAPPASDDDRAEDAAARGDGAALGGEPVLPDVARHSADCDLGPAWPGRRRGGAAELAEPLVRRLG